MTFHPPTSPGPITQEAESTRYARDAFKLRLLSTGHIAIYDSTHTYMGSVDTIHEVLPATEHLRTLATRDRMEAETARIALARRVEERAALDTLEIDL